MTRFSRHILLLSASALLAACNLQPMGSRVDAEEEFKKLEQPEVEGVEGTLLATAKSSMESGNYENAVSMYRQLYDDHGRKPEYKKAYAEALRRSGDYDRAILTYEELLKETPGDVEAMESLGLSLMAKGKTNEAGRQFGDVMKKDAKRWKTLNALGILFAARNMVDEANAYFNEALKFSPQNASVLNNAGIAQAIDKNYPRAVASLSQASQLATSGTDQQKQIDMNLALVYGISGDLERARAVASRYLDGPALDNNLGLYAYLSKNDELAKSYLNMALSHSTVHYERAWHNLEVVEKDISPEMPMSSTQKRVKVK